MIPTIVQKWTINMSSPLEMGIKYYSLLSVVNNLGLTRRQIQLLAFTCERGSISSPSAKAEFCKRFKSTVDTVNNMISELKELKYLQKENGKIFVNPQLSLNFGNNFVINIHLNGLTTEDNK